MKVFYHNDNDGKVAAHMVYLAESRYNPELCIKDFYPVNYGDKIPSADLIEKDEEVYIVDYSFTEKTFGQLAAIALKADGNVHWYDHHKSSLEIADFVKTKKICMDVCVDMDRSGCGITFDKLIKDTDIDSGNENIRKIVTYVEDYDLWRHEYPESLFFNNGSMMYKCGPLDLIWELNPTEVISVGKIITKYRELTDTKNAKGSSYNITINDIPCIVLNTTTKSSQAFGKLYEKFKIAIRWSFTGEYYEYSVYSQDENIDCSLIAKHFDSRGGGHKGAAGFRSDKMLFKSGNSFRIRLPKAVDKNEKV